MESKHQKNSLSFPTGITNLEARSPHNELSSTHPCLLTLKISKDRGISPFSTPPASPKGQEGPACCKCTPANPRLPPLLQLQPKGKGRTDCISTVTLKNGLLVARAARFTFLAHLHNAKLFVGAGLHRDFPMQARAAPTILTPLLPEPWPLLLPSQALPPFGKHGGAWRSFPGLAGQGREANPACFFTIVLREKPARFQVKLFLADLLLEPELQVGPVPREEQGTTESIRLEKTSETIGSNLSTPPCQADLGSFPEPLR